MWWLASRATRHASRQKRHALLESLGPLLLPLVALLLVLIAIFSFALMYWPRMEQSFHWLRGIQSTWRESLYFSGVTLLTIGYGDVTPTSGLVQFLALAEGVSGLAILSLFTAYLLTVNEAVQNKRAAASSLYIQSAKQGDSAALLALYFRRGQFVGLEELMRGNCARLEELMEAHVEHPVIHYFHSSAVYKSFPRFLFLLLETATIIDTVLDPTPALSSRTLPSCDCKKPAL